MDIYQKFIHQRTYARWDYAAGRRESWEDSVDRVGDFFTKIASKLTKNKDLHSYLSEALVLIREQEIVPSMRVFWTAGPALEREHLAGYNCAAIAIDSLFVLPEILYMLMCGTGVGFSVESHFINKISPLPSKFTKSKKTIVFEDSKQGWAEGYKQVIASLYEGQIPQYDMSKIRPKGAILKTFGGRSSGPEALIDLIETTINTLVDQKGAPLRPIQVHDLACAVLSTVVVGGVRRAAGISLSDLGDLEMAQAKTGEFWHNHPQRCMTNNSAVYNSRPAPAIFLTEWINLIRSKSGERGIFNREAANFTAARTFRRKLGYDWLCNPCTEVVLRPDGGLCNLSEVIVRPDDTLDMLCQKVTGATLLGVLQSTLTKFNFVNKNWRRNAEEERLLGVSLTGLMDHPVLQRTSSDARLWLKHMKQAALDAAEKYSKIVGIPMPAAVTCLKPSGCRPWDGLVTTKQGVFTLEDLLESHTSNGPWSDLSGYDAIGGGNVTKTYINGTTNVMEVRLSFGMSVKSTPNHQWYVVDRGWVRTDQLKPGDQIEVHSNIYQSTTEADLLRLNPAAIHCRSDCDTILQPSKMAPDVAWLLGYLWGDGAMSPAQYRLRWSDQRVDNLRKVQRILSEQFGLWAEIHQASHNRKAMVLEVGSKFLWHWLIKNGVWKYYAEHLDIIPKIVRSSSKESIIAFIAGLIDADGWANNNALTLTTADKNFANHVQHIGWAVGVCFGQSKNIGGKNFQKKKEMYLMNLLGNSSADSLLLLAKHCGKFSVDHAVFNRERICRPGVVKSVVALPNPVPTFDVETSEHWFYAGAVKSHNTVSQLANTSSGLHPRFADYYIRRVRVTATDPLARYLIDKGVPHHPEVGEDHLPTPNTWVFDFPIKAPECAITRDQLSAKKQLEYWKMIQTHWCEQSASCTIYVNDDEWPAVAGWVYNNWNVISGLSFLPKSDSVYQLAPYEEIPPEQYKELVGAFPADLDFDDLSAYEAEDYTTGSQELACTGGACEL